MEIERLQIEGGFLDGFDVKFASGLNVLIGARGTGKTSVIELIRFALAARSHTAEAGARSAEHAKAVLDDGSVTIKLGDIIDTVTVMRPAGDDEPQATGKYEKPLVFSQTEIENLGLSESGRLRLLDGFVSGSAKLASDEAAAVAAIRSVFKEITAAEADRANYTSGLDGLAALNERIKVLEQQELLHRASSVDLAGKQKQLDSINGSISASTVREGVLERFAESAEGWAEAIADLVGSDFGSEVWDPLDGHDPLDGFRDEYGKLVTEAHSLGQRFDALAGKAASVVCPA